MDAYLDIETTGLMPGENQITVIGIYLPELEQGRVVQLVGRDVTEPNLLEALADVHTIYTYNGSRFDLPFIRHALGTDLFNLCRHHDLMYDCWKCNLKGGLKRVEVTLNIGRELQGVTGWDAVLLWQRWVDWGDTEALEKLLHYNREDVVNLKTLREKLEEIVW